MGVDSAQELLEADVSARHGVGEVVTEDGAGAVEANESSRDRDPESLETVETEVFTAVRAAEREQWHALRGLEVR